MLIYYKMKLLNIRIGLKNQASAGIYYYGLKKMNHLDYTHYVKTIATSCLVQLFRKKKKFLTFPIHHSL